MFITLKQLSTQLNIPKKTLIGHYRKGVLPCDKQIVNGIVIQLLFDSKRLSEYYKNLETWQNKNRGKKGKPPKIVVDNINPLD